MRYQFKAAEEIMWGAMLAFLTAFCSTYVAGQGTTDKTTLLLTATAAGGRPAVAFIATALTAFFAKTRDSFFTQVAKYAPQPSPSYYYPPDIPPAPLSGQIVYPSPAPVPPMPMQSADVDHSLDMAPPPPNP